MRRDSWLHSDAGRAERARRRTHELSRAVSSRADLSFAEENELDLLARSLEREFKHIEELELKRIEDASSSSTSSTTTTDASSSSSAAASSATSS